MAKQRRGPSTRACVRCPVCTSSRTPDVLDTPVAPAARMVMTFAGRGNITWEAQPLPYDEAVKMRERMRRALAELDADIAAAEAEAA